MTTYYHCPECDKGRIEVPIERDDESECDCDMCPFYCDAGYARGYLIEVEDD